MKRFAVAAVMLPLLTTGPVPVPATEIPIIPYVEVEIATEGPLSLFCVPDGSGNAFTEAYNQLGEQVDGTLTMTLYSDQPGWGEPVPNYPREDLWLMDTTGNLAVCWEGSIADANTDAFGVTTWSGALLAGGQLDPAAGHSLAVFVSGWILGEMYLTDIRINSSDFNGDLVNNLTDIAMFTQHYFGAYDYAYDLRWDGAINLSDLTLLAESHGASCP